MPDRSRPWRTTSFRRRASSASSSASSSSRETFASLLSSERHLWREDGRGRLVGTVLERGRAGDHGARWESNPRPNDDLDLFLY